MTPDTPIFTRGTPKRFTAAAVFVSSLFGFILVLPVLAAVLVVTLIQFGFWTFLIPLAAIGLAMYVLPLGFGNPYIASLARRLHPASRDPANSYVVQLSASPRIRSGLLAIVEDADDVGLLVFTGSTLEFYGDCVRLSIPFGEIKNLAQRNAGARALFAYGHQMVFNVPSIPVGLFRFAERSSWVLPASRRTAEQMFQQLKVKIALVEAERTSSAGQA